MFQRLILFLFTLTMLVGCDNKSEMLLTEFDQSKLNQQVDADATEATFSFTAADNWTTMVFPADGAKAASTDLPLWISVSPAQGGAGKVQLVMTLMANDTETDRRAVVGIQCGASSLQLTVTQRATGSSSTPPVPEGKVKRIAFDGGEMMPLRYNAEGRVTAIGDDSYYNGDNGVLLKEMANGELVYISTSTSRQYNDYQLSSSGHIEFISLSINDVEREGAKFGWNDNFLGYVSGQQLQVTDVITTQLTPSMYTQSAKCNFDIAFYLATQEHYGGAQFPITSFDGRVGKNSSFLPATRTLTGTNTDKYNATYTYRYVVEKGCIVKVYSSRNQENEVLILQLEY